MTYSIRLPDGTLVQNIPDEVTPEAAKARILKARPDLAPKERSLTEAVTDIGAGAVSGLGSLVQLPGQLYGLATGNMEKTGALGLGEDIQKYGEEMKSSGLKAREAARSRKVEEAEKRGQGAAFLTSFAETIKDPALLSSFLAEQVPQLVVPGAAAGVAGRSVLKRGVIAGLEEATAKEAAIKAGTSAAVRAGAVQQGADVGSQAYEDIYAKLRKEGKSEPEAAGIAINLARAAGASGAIISLLAQRLPGAKALEEALAGGKGVSGMVGGAFKGALGEGLSESVEEGGGKFTQNLAMREVDPTQALMQGVGATAGQAAVGGVGMGGGAGAISGFRGNVTPEAQAQAQAQVPGQPTGAEAAAQAARDARAQEQMGVQQGRSAREGEKLIDAEAKAEADQQQAARVEAEKAAATELQALRAQRQAELEQTFPKDYSDVMQKTDAYATLFQEKQALLGQTETKEVKARIKTIDGLIQGIIEEDNRVPNEFKRMQAENAKVIKNLPPDLQAKYAATAFTIPEPQQMEIRAATVEQPPVQQTDLLGQPIEQEAPPPAAPDKFKTVQTAAEAQAALDLQNRRDARAGQAERNAAKDAGQLGLFTRVGTPTAEAAVPEPKIIVKKPPVTEPTVRVKPTPETVAPVITADTLGVLGIGPTAVMRKPGHAIQGLDITKPDDAAEVRNMLTIYKEGRSPAIVQKIDTFLGRPEFQALPAPALKVAPAPVVAKTPAARAVKPNERPIKVLELEGGPLFGGPIKVGLFQEGDLDLVAYRFTSDGRRVNEPIGNLSLEKGSLDNDIHYAAEVNVDELLRGQGLAESIYTAMANLGFKIKQSPDQSAQGQKMWEGFERKGLVRPDGTFVNNTKTPKTVKTKTTGQSAEKKAANKAAQPSAKKAETAPAPTKVAEAPPAPAPAPAPIKVVKKTEPKKVEPKKVEPKKVEPKKLEAPKVEPKKEEPKVDKALEKARETVDDLDLDPDTTKTKVKSFAKRLHKAGLIDDISLNAIESISKDRDMGYEDVLDEVRFALDAYERQQGQAPETKPEPKKVTDESNIIEGETRVIPDNEQKLLENPVNRLQDDQVEELEDFYGVKKDNPEFWKKLRVDVAKSINEGSKAVAKAIREIINQIASGVLAVGLIFNPNGLTNQYNINLQKTFQETTSVTAPVPEVAKAKMSPLAQDVYSAMAPVAMKSGKWFMVADKPNGMMHIFKEDGSHALSDPTLYGKDKGDVMEAVSSLKGGAKITPAGKFTLQSKPSEYAGKQMLVLVESKDSTGYIAIHAADTSDVSENRLGRLDTPTAEDNRVSYGCINTKHDTFVDKIVPNIGSLDGGLIFVLPETAEATAEMFKPETKVVERTETSTTAKAEGVRDIAKKEEKLAETQALQKPAADLSFVNRPVSVEADLQAKLQEGDVRGALQAILKAPAGVYNDLDRAVARRILLSNKLPSIELVAAGALGREGDKIVAGQYDAQTDKIQLVNGYAGAHVLLHELVHGFVHRAIALQGAGKLNNSGIRNLQELYDYVAKVDPKIIKEYGMTNLSEFASEAMSNKEFQAALMAIPYRRNSNIFTAFANAVLKALGLAADAQQTALASAMLTVDSIMTEGRKLQESLTGTEVEGSLPGIAPVMVKELDAATRQSIKDIQAQFPTGDQAGVGGTVTQALKGVQSARENSGVMNTFRQAVADKYATVEAKVSTMFSQGVRDYFGNINPMVLARQAEDSAKIVMDFFRAGGIRLTKDGLVESYKQGKSMVTALQKVGEYARANNLSYEEAKNEISTVLEGHRLHNINEEHNKPLEASALLLEQQGKNKEADAERKKKIFMHMDLKQIATLEKAYQQSAGIREIQDDLNATRTQAVDLMIATGRLTKEQGQFWKDNNSYVPFSRVFEDAVPNMVYRGKGIGILKKLPGMEGSLGRPVKNVLDSYANRLSWMVEDSMKNHAAVKLLETMELGGFAQEVPTREKAKNPNLVVSLYRDGKPVLFEVQNEYDILAFQQAPEMMNGLTKVLGATSRLLRLSITAMPPFAIKQVIEDAQRAAFYSGVERPLVVAMKTLYNMPRVFFGEITGRKSPMVRRMEELGIVGDYDFNIYQPVSDIEKEIGEAKRNVGQKLFHRLEQFTKASDLAARLAVYEETMRETKGDEVLAQTRARELINFTRRGSSPVMRTAARVIPFFNAYAQGMDVLYRSATGLDSSSALNRAAARKLFLSRVAIMSALGFVYALSMSDDEGYKNATDEVRDNNWILPNGYKFGVPKELGFLFKSIPERIVDYYRRYGTDEEQSVMQALGSVAKGAMSAYGSPNVTPSFIKPILENMTNYSFFLQRELESASLKRLEPGQRYTSSTSELAKALGEETNVSPIKIDNFLRGMFGMAGSTTLLMTDAVLNPTRPDRPLYQMPFASLFLYDTIGGRAKNEFYDLQEKVSQVDATYKALLGRDPEKAQTYLEKNEALISIAPIISNSLEQLSATRKYRTMYEQGTEEMLGMTGAERREAIDEMRKLENEMLSYIRELRKSVSVSPTEPDED